MRAGERACACPECGVVCQGLFDGCPEVWARGPRPVTLTSVPALGGNGTGRVRALSAGAAPSAPRQATAGPPPPPSAPPPPTAPPLSSPPPLSPPLSSQPPLSPPPPAPSAPPPTNGFTGSQPPPPPTNGFTTSQPPPLPPRTGGNGTGSGQTGSPRTEVLQWFEDAFDELRNELHAVVSTVTRQQAMLAELLDSREAELRVVLVAESLPELAGEAAAKALAEESGGLADTVSEYLEDFRLAVQASEESSLSVMDGMRELLQRVELTAEINTEEARLEGAARLEALKASVGRQLRPVSAAVAEISASLEAAEAREAARTRALKATMTKQLQPLAASVEAAVERSDRQFAEIRDRLDALAAAAPVAPAPRKARPAATKAKPRATRATRPDPPPVRVSARRPRPHIGGA